MSQMERKDNSEPLEAVKESKTNDLLDIIVRDSLKPADDHSKEEKIESVLIEDGDAAALYEKGNLGNDGNLGKKDKKRGRESTEDNHLCTKKAEIEEKEQGAIDEPECDLESSKKKKKMKHVVREKEPKAKGKSRKVSFSDHVEVFPSPDTANKKPKTQKDDLLRGKRFTPEEDEMVKEAVLDYIKKHDLGGEEEGLAKILHSGSYPKLRNCWKEIGSCLPYRPSEAIYYRAHVLFERSEKSGWTKEETEVLQKCYEKYGNNWKLVAAELGKHRIHVKDKWRKIRPINKKVGKWSQEEYQQLYDLVNQDLQVKVVCEEKKSKYGMLRDNIHWTAISDKLSTRSDSTCCRKWYSQLTSSLVAENKWSNVDDYRLVSALYDLDAACVEDVDWDDLLEHRSGDICRKRWDQMVNHIGHHGSKPFSEQVEILSQRYRPDIEETREAWDNKPVVD